MLVKRYGKDDLEKLIASKQAFEHAIEKTASVAFEKADGEDPRVLQFTISDGSVDRDGDTIAVDGWDLSEFNKAGVVLWAHDSGTPPIASPVATWVEGGKLKSRARFPGADSKNQLGALVFEMYKDGTMKATSVGFMPRKWQVNEERAPGPRGMAIDFLEQALLEWSAVPVPANPNALYDAAKRFDLRPLADWAMSRLDSDDAGEVVRSGAAVVMKGLLRVDLPKSHDLPDLRMAKKPAKRAISYAAAHADGTPMASRDDAWDGSSEVAAATVDGLKVMSTWVEDGAEDKKSAYKLPHHKAEGEHAVVWRGVVAAMNALLGGRGGTDIPEADRRAVYNHLAEHYRDFGEDPPEFKGLDINASDVDAVFNACKAIMKRGRVLSSSNEERLRQARDLLSEVIAQVDDGADGEACIEITETAEADGDEMEIDEYSEEDLGALIGAAVGAALQQQQG